MEGYMLRAISKILSISLLLFLSNVSAETEVEEISVMGQVTMIDYSRDMFMIGNQRIIFNELKNHLKNNDIKIKDEVYVRGEEVGHIIFAFVLMKVTIEDKEIKIDPSICCDPIK
jgi:hypothetical protein